MDCNLRCKRERNYTVSHHAHSVVRSDFTGFYAFMQGLHLTGDLSGCRCAEGLLTDAARLEARCTEAVAAAGLTQVQRLFHSFAPGAGVTGVVLLAESHLAVHTWPELGSVTLDIYVCNYGGDNSAKAQALFDRLTDAFDPAHCVRHDLQRGVRDADADTDKDTDKDAATGAIAATRVDPA